MKRKATIDERRFKNSVTPSLSPLPLPKRRNLEQRARDATSEFFKQHRTPLTTTLRDIFGEEFFARAALLIDPLITFQNVFGLIALESRYRSKTDFSVPSKITYRYRTLVTSTQEEDNPFPVEDHVVSDEVEDRSYEIDTGLWYNFSQCWDSLSKDRGWDTTYNFAGLYNSKLPTYGYFELEHGSAVLESPRFLNYADEEKIYLTELGLIRGIFTKYLTSNNVYMEGPISTVTSGSLYIPEIREFTNEFMNQNIWGILPKALANNKVYDLTYNIAELKDIPGMIRSIADLEGLIRKAAKGEFDLLTLDKEIANLNLLWEFGIKPTRAALADLLKLPRKLTEKVNFLIQRNGKVSTCRYTQKFKNIELPHEVPSFEFDLGDTGLVVQNEQVTRTCEIELRCVVNQTIQFPSLAVPDDRGTVYQDLLGVSDVGDFVDLVYQLYPFSWLVDWFVGIGDYIHVMNAVHSDKQLINFGFLTAVVTQKVTHTCEFVAPNRRYHWIDNSSLDLPDRVLVEDNSPIIYPYKRVYTHKYQRRIDIGDLEGVKTFGSWQNNLSDFQMKILGSLTSQRL